MAWNRSQSDSPAKDSPRRTGTARPIVAVITGLIIVVGATVAAWWLWPNASAPVREGAGGTVDKRIKEVKPAAVPVPAVTNVVKKPKKVLDYARIAAEGKTVITNKAGEKIVLPHFRRANRPRPKYAIFAHESENRIAALIASEPGTRFFGTQFYDEKFKADFLKSCEEPIIISKDDDEETKRLKREMIETKIELRNRMNEGEDLCKIMADSRKELQRLGIVKQQMQDMLRKEIAEKAKSEGDFDDFVSAANKILEDKGIAPIKMTPIVRQTVLRAIENRAKDKQTEE